MAGLASLPAVMGPGGPIEMRSTLRVALVVGALVTAALACVPWVIIAELDVPFGWLLESYGLVGFVTAGVGFWLWDRRPANRSGLLLVVVGLFEIAAAFGNTDNRFLALVGHLAAEAPIAALAHLVLAFPSGRLATRTERMIVVAHYVVSIGWQIPMYVFLPADPMAFGPLQIAGHEDWLKRSNDLQGLMSGVLLVAAAWIVVRRLRLAPFRMARRPLALVSAYGIFVLVSFPLSSRVLRPHLHWDVYTLFGLQLIVVLGVPFVYGIAMFAGGLARTVEIRELSGWLALPDDHRPPLRDALARALGDQSIELRYRVDGVLVDDHGHPVRGPTGAHRRSCPVVGPNGVAAVIVYDGDLNEEGMVAAAGRVVSLALERERLHTELVASGEELRRSRLRIVEQADLERRQLARDLHDGVQGRLVLAALHAGQLANGDADQAAAVRLRNEIDAAITELRQLVQGVLPAMLVDRGLFVAAEELVDRMPIDVRLTTEPSDDELPWQVASAAYFVIAEALANVVKHSGATAADVVVARRNGTLHLSVSDDGAGGASTAGSGIQGIADRVGALGGRLQVLSEPGGGTRVEAELPCES